MTSYAETKMLEHVMDGDLDDAKKLATDSTSFELGQLHGYLCTMLDIVNETREEKIS